MPPTNLNQEQQLIYIAASNFLSYESRRRANLAYNEVSVAPPILLVHGAPGTGKSFVVSSITDRAISLGLGTLPCAFTGAAASNLGGGQITSERQLSLIIH